MLIDEKIRALPKVELHRHLELSGRHSTLRELARDHGLNINSPQDFTEAFIIPEPMKDLGTAVNKFLIMNKILTSYEILERLAYEACCDAYTLEGIRLLELRYAPTFIKASHTHFNFQSIHEAILKGLQRAQKEYPIGVALICTLQRILSVAQNQKVVDFVLENKDTFAGVDLADNEAGFEPEPFAPCFERVKKQGLKVTIHAGEINTAEAPQYVKDAVDYLQADRIGHGVQVYKNPEVMQLLAEKQIPLELCITSNYLTQAVPTLRSHPVRQIMKHKVPVTINTDDPSVFDTDMNREYQILASHYAFNEAEFRACNATAAQHSFIDDQQKQKYWTSLDKKQPASSQ